MSQINSNFRPGSSPKGEILSDGDNKVEFPLGRRNFRFMILSAVLIVGGFLLMLGGSSTSEFNPDIFSARRIVVGPTIAFIGFVCMAVAIILKPSKSGK